MATPKVVPVPLAFGVGARIDPKLCPFGVLRRAKNQRIRKDGRLGVRNGYEPLAMTTRSARALVARDLHEYQNRLIALGSDDGGGADSVIWDLYEYTGLANAAWRGIDPGSARVIVNPLTNPREIAGVVQPSGGCTIIDAACGDGYACLVYSTVDSVFLYALIVDVDTDQTVFFNEIAAGSGIPSTLTIEHARVTFVGGAFYVAYATTGSGTWPIVIKKFVVGTSSTFNTIVANADGISTTARPAFDFAPVTNGTTAAVALAFGHGASAAPVVNIYGPTGTQIGSSISVPGLVTHISVEADQTHGTVNVFTVESTSGILRTFDFAGALLVGPTTLFSDAISGAICRMPAQGTMTTPDVACVVNRTGDIVAVQCRRIDTHAANSSNLIHEAAARSRPVSAQSPRQDNSVVFAGRVGPELPSLDGATNALFYVSRIASHMVARDLARAEEHEFTGLQRLDDGRIAWIANRDPGVESAGIPIVTLVDLLSTERRQMANFGGLLHGAGATPLVYDGRFAQELGFNELPGVQSLVGSTSTGALTPGGTYYYTVHWEVVLADGSLMLSPVSVGGNRGESITDDASSVTLTGTQNAVTVTVTTPHRVLLTTGEAAFGATLVCVVSRTQWIALNTKATLLGTRDFTATPATAGNFTGLTLQLQVDGGATQTVTFSATDDSLDELVAKINAQTTGLTATDVGGSIYLESDSAGAASSLVVVGGTTTVAGVGFSGFLPGDTSTGETDGAPGSTLHRCVTASPSYGSVTTIYGATISIVDTVSDDDIASGEPLYTQGERGALSGPLEQYAPRGCAYIAASESRLLTGGLARAFEAQISRSAFLSEAFSFSEFSPFFTKASGAVLGVESLDQTKLLFTRDAILAVGGDGPDDVGGGSLDPPVELPTPSGIKTAWSLLKGPDGLWVQLDDNKLFRIPRGGGSPSWEGVDVRDLLDLYPEIVGTARHKRDNCGVFACNGGGSGQFLVRDFLTEQWLHDTMPGSGTLAALTSFGNSIAYAMSTGSVYVQSTSSFADSSVFFIETYTELHPIYPFGLGGYGEIYEVQVTGEFRGDCRLYLEVSYDDSSVPVSLDGYDLLSTTYAVGQPFSVRWTLPRSVTSAVKLALSVTSSSQPGAAGTSEGLVFNDISLLVNREDGLRELAPSEMA